MYMSQFRKNNTLLFFILCLIMCVCMILFILTNQSVKKIVPEHHFSMNGISSHIPCTKKEENNLVTKRVSLVNCGTQKMNFLDKINNCTKKTRISYNQKLASIKKDSVDIRAFGSIEKELFNSRYPEVKQQTITVYLKDIVGSHSKNNTLLPLQINNQLKSVKKTESHDLHTITKDCNLLIVKSQNTIKDEENIIKNNNVLTDVHIINHKKIDRKSEKDANDDDDLQNKYNRPKFKSTNEKKIADVREKCYNNLKEFANMQFEEPERDQARYINNEIIKYKDFEKKLLNEKETAKKETGENKSRKNEAGKEDIAKTIHQEDMFGKELELKTHNILIEEEQNNRDNQNNLKQEEDDQLENNCDLKEHETALDFLKKKNLVLQKNDIDINSNDKIDAKPVRKSEDLDQKITKDDFFSSFENLKVNSNSKIIQGLTSVSSNVYSDTKLYILEELKYNITGQTNKKEDIQKTSIDIDNSIKLKNRSELIAKTFIEKKNMAEVAENNDYKGTCNDISLNSIVEPKKVVETQTLATVSKNINCNTLDFKEHTSLNINFSLCKNNTVTLKKLQTENKVVNKNNHVYNTGVLSADNKSVVNINTFDIPNKYDILNIKPFLKVVNNNNTESNTIEKNKDPIFTSKNDNQKNKSDIRINNELQQNCENVINECIDEQSTLRYKSRENDDIDLRDYTIQCNNICNNYYITDLAEIERKYNFYNNTHYISNELLNERLIELYNEYDSVQNDILDKKTFVGRETTNNNSSSSNNVYNSPASIIKSPNYDSESDENYYINNICLIDTSAVESEAIGLAIETIKLDGQNYEIEAELNKNSDINIGLARKSSIKHTFIDKIKKKISSTLPLKTNRSDWKSKICTVSQENPTTSLSNYKKIFDDRLCSFADKCNDEIKPIKNKIKNILIPAKPNFDMTKLIDQINNHDISENSNHYCNDIEKYKKYFALLKGTDKHKTFVCECIDKEFFLTYRKNTISTTIKHYEQIGMPNKKFINIRIVIGRVTKTKMEMHAKANSKFLKKLINKIANVDSCKHKNLFKAHLEHIVTNLDNFYIFNDENLKLHNRKVILYVHDTIKNMHYKNKKLNFCYSCSFFSVKIDVYIDLIIENFSSPEKIAEYKNEKK